METKGFDIKFKPYDGKKIFSVYHPDYGTVRALAPDETAAIVAAADHWKQKWTAIDFYAYCQVCETGKIGGKKA